MDSSPSLKCAWTKCVASGSRTKSTIIASKHTALIASCLLGIPSTWKGPTGFSSPGLNDAFRCKKHPCTCMSFFVWRSVFNEPHTGPPSFTGRLCVWVLKTSLKWWVLTSRKKASLREAGALGISPPEAGRLPCSGKASASSNSAVMGFGGWPCHDEDEVISNNVVRGAPAPGCLCNTNKTTSEQNVSVSSSSSSTSWNNSKSCNNIYVLAWRGAKLCVPLIHTCLVDVHDMDVYLCV